MSEHRWTFLGAALFATLPALFAAALSTHEASAPLEVDLSSREAHVVLAAPTMPLPQFRVGPPSLGRRLVDFEWQPLAPSGTWLRTYSAAWGDRWVEEATLPALVGPFHRPDDFVCGYRIGVSAAVLDTRSAAKPILAALARDLQEVSLAVNEVVKECGLTVRVNVSAPVIVDADVQFKFVAGALVVGAGITLSDGSWVRGEARLRLVSRDGTPVIELVGAPSSTYKGPFFDAIAHEAQRGAEAAVRSNPWGVDAACARKLGWEGDVYALLAGSARRPLLEPLRAALLPTVLEKAVPHARARALDTVARLIPARVKSKVSAGFRGATEKLNGGLQKLTSATWSPFGDDETHIAFRLADQPAIDETGIQASICLQWSSPEPDFGADVPGSVAFPEFRVPTTSLPKERPAVRVLASPAALNQLLWGVWRAGKVREYGAVSRLLALLDEDERARANELLQKLAFDVRGVDPKLPPTIAAGRDGELIVSVADADVGTFEGRRLVAHAQGRVTADSANGDVRVGLAVERVSANCVEAIPGRATRLVPCLSDMLPALREQLRGLHRTVTFGGTEVLARIPLADFDGFRLRLSNLEVKSLQPGPLLDIGVDAAFEALAPDPEDSR